MSSIHNPFQSLYVTERVSELDFPAIFSPALIPLVQPLFLPGNVLLSGTQGTGKSMLLALLDSQIRVSFWEDKKNPYPVLDDSLCKFVGANINLSTSLVMKFNERRFASDEVENVQRSQAVFSDYLNTWVIRDLLQSLNKLSTDALQPRLRECGINVTRSKLDSVAKCLSQSEQCSGLVPNIDNYDAAIEALSKRLRTYLDFINFKLDKIPQSTWSSITGIGEPISATANMLKETGVLKRGTEVFVTVDQCEELLRLEQSDTQQQEHGRFRAMLDKLISSREKAVSYRIGTRPNAVWKGKSEEVRDYLKIDLDLLFGKTEHSSSLFPKFAKDVFFRRLRGNEEAVDEKSDLLQVFFGKSPTSNQRASECAPEKRPERILKLEKDWPDSVKTKFKELANEDVLSAKLGEAWFRQASAKIKENANVPEKERMKAKHDLEEFMIGKHPWQEEDRKWWKKERTGQAILQIAASNAQRIPYYGKQDILALSGRNILVFALICQKIWENWIQSTDANSTEISVPRPFSKWRQDEGVRAASNIWHSKISSAPNADTVRRLIDELGSRLRRQLRDDKTMSYPGANGFSLSNVDLEAEPEIKELLEYATAEGFLQVRRHTPKSPSRGQSQKWYTHPVLAPFYGLTVAHTKEPLYLTVAKLRSWLEKAQVVERREKPVKQLRLPKPMSGQQTLFDDETDE